MLGIKINASKTLNSPMANSLLIMAVSPLSFLLYGVTCMKPPFG